MRGEHLLDTLREYPSMGSSPHARGTLQISDAGSPACRLIPACAGNTGRLFLARSLMRAHPRMRGEHIKK